MSKETLQLEIEKMKLQKEIIEQRHHNHMKELELQLKIEEARKEHFVTRRFDSRVSEPVANGRGVKQSPDTSSTNSVNPVLNSESVKSESHIKSDTNSELKEVMQKDYFKELNEAKKVNKWNIRNI